MAGAGRILAVVSLLVLAVAVGPTLAGVATAGGRPTTGQLDDGVAHSRDPSLVRPHEGDGTGNNSTVHHRDPEEFREPGQLGQLRGWLAGRMGEVLIDCTEGLQVGDYAVCDQVDGDYPEWLSKYVDVVQETETNDDDGTGDAFGSAETNQKSFAEDVESFRETYESYRRAREAGNDKQARVYARQLTRYAESIASTGAALERDYRWISNRSDAGNLTRAIPTIEATVGNVTAIAQRVERDEFVATRVTASANQSRVSFSDPARITGRLVVVNGSAVADERIRVRIGKQVVRTRTNASGGFSLVYRPTLVRRLTDEVTLTVLPANASVYSRASTTLPLDVVQVRPNVSVTPPDDAVEYRDRVRIAGRVAVDDVGVGGVPVVVRVGDWRVGRVRTDSVGRFALVGRLPADVVGNVTVVATIPLDERAIEGVQASGTLAVRNSSTRIALGASSTGNCGVRLAGQVLTVEGDPVAGQPVTVLRNGTAVATLRTDPDGGFETVRSLPAATRNGTVRIEAGFDGAGTNLRSVSNATTVVVDGCAGVGTASDSGLAGILRDGPIGTVYVLLGLAGVLTAVGVLWWRRPAAVRAAGERFVTALPGPLGSAVRELADRIGPRLRTLGSLGNGAVRSLGVVVTGARGLLSRGFGWLVAAVIVVADRFRSVVGSEDESEPSLRESDGTPTETDRETDVDPISGTETAGPGAADASGPPSTLLKRAQRQLEAGDPDAAVETAYTAARTHLDGEPESAGLTHWEFLRAREGDLPADRARTFRELTTAYEVAAFAPWDVDRHQASEAVGAAAQLGVASVRDAD